MVTLMMQSTSDGVRRCDARCYHAKRPDCRCICGGRNHGVGLRQARESTRALAEELLRETYGEWAVEELRRWVERGGMLQLRLPDPEKALAKEGT